MQAGRAEVRAVIERARAAAGLRGQGDGLLPGRDPPLQQGPAGRAAAGGRGRAGDVDRGDDREPVLRGQLRADLAFARVRARAAVGGRCAGAARPGGGARGVRAGPRASTPEALEFLAERSGGRCPDGAERAGAGLRGRGADGGVGARPRTRSSAGRSSTTARPIATTTRSRPGSRRPAGRTRRLAVLPGRDARGRRGSSVHRPADGRPGLRGHRQRRPAGAGGGHRGGARRSSTWACPSASSRWPRRRSTCRWPPSRMPPSGRSSRPASTSASTARIRRPRTCAPPPAATAATTTPTARPGHFSPQELMPDHAIGQRFYEPDDAEAGAGASAWRRSAGRAARERRVAGAWPEPVTAGLESFNPATGELLGTWPRPRPQTSGGGRGGGQVQPFWAQLTLGDRARYLSGRRRWSSTSRMRSAT